MKKQFIAIALSLIVGFFIPATSYPMKAQLDQLENFICTINQGLSSIKHTAEQVSELILKKAAKEKILEKIELLIGDLEGDIKNTTLKSVLSDLRQRNEQVIALKKIIKKIIKRENDASLEVKNRLKNLLEQITKILERTHHKIIPLIEGVITSLQEPTHIEEKKIDLTEAYKKLPDNALEYILSFLKLQDLANVQLSMNKKLVSLAENVLPNVSVNDFSSLQYGPEILRIYFKVRDLGPYRGYTPAENDSPKDIVGAYFLALQTNIKNIQEKLRRPSENALKKIEKAEDILDEDDEVDFFNRLPIPTPDQAKKIVSTLVNLNAALRGYALSTAAFSGHEVIVNQMLDNPDFMNQISAEERGYALENAHYCHPEIIVKKMLNSPEFMNGISADSRGSSLRGAALKNLDALVKQMLDNPDFMFGISAKDKTLALYLTHNINIAKLLLNRLNFTIEQLEEALRNTSNKKIQNLIQEKLKA